MEASALRAPAGLSRISVPAALLRLRSDDQLVSLFRRGSDEAFGALHDRYSQRILAYARQMLGGARADAEDAVQDVFLRAYSALRADDRPVAVKAWLYRVAHNRCIDQLRRPVADAAEIFDLSRAPAPDPTAETERREELRRLVIDIQRLPAQQRSALLLRELEGLSYADLADALDVTVPAVKSLLVRARVGLVALAEARDTPCGEIRHDLALASGRGVRASAKARRHLRECSGCRSYRAELRAVNAGVRALVPGSGPFGLLAKLCGVCGLGGGGGAAVAGGGGAAAVTSAKVAAIVCCAAITAGGAAELRERGVVERHGATVPTAPSEAAAEAAPTMRIHAAATAAAARVTASARERDEPPSILAADEPISPHGIDDAQATSGGLAAPDESLLDPSAPVAEAEEPAAEPLPVHSEGTPDAAAADAATPPAAEEDEAAEPDDPSAAGQPGGLAAAP